MATSSRLALDSLHSSKKSVSFTADVASPTSLHSPLSSQSPSPSSSPASFNNLIMDTDDTHTLSLPPTIPPSPSPSLPSSSSSHSSSTSPPCTDCSTPPPHSSSLTHRLTAFKTSFLPQLQRLLGDERYRTFSLHNLHLQSLTTPRPALSVGDYAPPFSLPDHTGQLTHLHDLLSSHHVIVHFYRGSWCPYCNLALQAHAEFSAEYDDYGATFVAITPSLPSKTEEQMREHAFPFPLLTDTHLEVIPAYHLLAPLTPELIHLHKACDGLNVDLGAFYGNELGQLPIPATFIIERGSGRIVWAHVDADFTVRADPLDIIEKLQELRIAEEQEGDM